MIPRRRQKWINRWSCYQRPFIKYVWLFTQTQLHHHRRHSSPFGKIWWIINILHTATLNVAAAAAATAPEKALDQVPNRPGSKIYSTFPHLSLGDWMGSQSPALKWSWKAFELNILFALSLWMITPCKIQFQEVHIWGDRPSERNVAPAEMCVPHKEAQLTNAIFSHAHWQSSGASPRIVASSSVAVDPSQGSGEEAGEACAIRLLEKSGLTR